MLVPYDVAHDMTPDYIYCQILLESLLFYFFNSSGKIKLKYFFNIKKKENVTQAVKRMLNLPQIIVMCIKKCTPGLVIRKKKLKCSHLAAYFFLHLHCLQIECNQIKDDL